MKRDLPSVVAASLRDLVAAVTRLVHSIETSSAAPTSGRAADPAARGERLSRSLKAHWDTMSPKRRAARIRKMLAARGLKPKPKRKGPPSARSTKLKAALKAHWDALSPRARAARVEKMLAGRGLRPKAAKPA